MSKSTINEEVNRMRKIMGLNEGLGASIDEQMMSPKAVALRLVEMLPDDYNEADVERALDEYINTGAINREVAARYMQDQSWWDELHAKIREVKTQGIGEAEEVDLSKVDNPNAYTDDIFNHNAERAEDPFDDEEDSMRITIPIMSALSDIQERAPELAERINFIKALVQKMESNSVITDSELTALEKEFNTHSY